MDGIIRDIFQVELDGLLDVPQRLGLVFALTDATGQRGDEDGEAPLIAWLQDDGDVHHDEALGPGNKAAWGWAKARQPIGKASSIVAVNYLVPTGDARTRHLPPIHPGVFVAIDAILLAGVGFLVASIQDQVTPVALAGELPTRLFPVAGFRPAWMLLHALLLPVAFVALGQYRMLQPGTPGWSFPRLLMGFTALDLVFLAFLWLIGFSPDRVFVVANFSGGLLAVTLHRVVLNHRLRKQVLGGQRVRNALAVGISPALVGLTRNLIANPVLGRRVMGFAAHHLPNDAPKGAWTTTEPDAARAAIVENSLRQPRHLWVRYDAPDDAARQRLLDGLGIEEVYADARADHLQSWLAVCQTRGIDFHLVPNVPADLGVQPKPWSLGGTVLLDLHGSQISTLGWAAKRAMDVVGAIVGLLLGSPLMLAAAIAIKLEDPKLTIMYPGKRVGLKGRVFRMQKFTTMRANAQELETKIDLQAKNKREGPWFKLEADNDPRLTKSGKWIRKLTINEIPQFWNVLKGDMSLVGPRPPTPGEVATYLDYDFRYFQVLNSKPGMTGLWQVTARNDPSFDRRLALDLQYMREWSIWMDVKILFKTVGTVVTATED